MESFSNQNSDGSENVTRNTRVSLSRASGYHEKLSCVIIQITTVEPRYLSHNGNGKKFEIAGFQNNRGSVKFVTMNHFFNKIQYSMKKDTD